jgi:hypothetical protein
MLVHCVTIKFKESTTPGQIDAFHAALAALPDQIRVIRRSRHGRDLGERPTNAHYAIVSEFGSAEDFYTYLDHAAHQAVAREHLMPLSESWHSTQFLADG